MRAIGVRLADGEWKSEVEGKKNVTIANTRSVEGNYVYMRNQFDVRTESGEEAREYSKVDSEICEFLVPLYKAGLKAKTIG